MRKKVSIIGAGNVGATLGLLIAQSGLADVVLFDVVEGMPKGKALDLLEACPLWGSPSKVVGTNDYTDTEGSEIIVITAGFPRKPGMSRDDLLFANSDVVKEAAKRTSALSPQAKIIVITNPMDAMTYVAWRASGLPQNRVMGMGGVLDSSRFRTFISLELGVSPKDVEALVLGGHGDDMVPLPRFTTVKGVPITELLDREKIEALIKRTKTGGAEIVSLLKQGSAYYAPASSAFEMVRAIVLDEKRPLPCSAYLNGQYGIKGIFVGVPAVLGSDGVERVLELRLSPEEMELLNKSARSVQVLIEKLNT